MPAIRRVSKMPPACDRSGCMMEQARFSRRSRKPHLVKMRFARCDGQVGFAREFCHAFYVLTLDGFFDKHRLVGFERFDEDGGGLR